MKTLKKFALAFLVSIACAPVHAAVVKYNGDLANESGVAYAKTWTLPLNSYTIDQAAFQINWATQTIAATTFTDGSESTATITVANNASVSSATASDFLTVLTTNGLTNACITFFDGTQYMVCNGGRWRVDVTSDTAADIATQMSAEISVLLSTSNVSSNVYSTATVSGSFANSWTLSSNVSSITVNSANFTGGNPNACFSINNVSLCANSNFFVGTSSAITANNIATAINANTTLDTILVATAPLNCGVIPACGVVSATTTVDGINPTLFTSSNPVITINLLISSTTAGVGTGAFSAGISPSYTLVKGSATIIVATNPFSPLTDVLSATVPTPMVALPVLYTNSGTTLGGLTVNTTYYIIPVTNGSYGLATTAANAEVGTFITLTSSTSKVGSDTFTLSPLAYTTSGSGASGLWQVSNDGENWSTFSTTAQNVSVSSSTFTPTYPVGTSEQDLGTIDYTFMRFNLNNPPTGGGLILQIIPNAKNSSQ